MMRNRTWPFIWGLGALLLAGCIGALPTPTVSSLGAEATATSATTPTPTSLPPAPTAIAPPPRPTPTFTPLEFPEVRSIAGRVTAVNVQGNSFVLLQPKEEREFTVRLGQQTEFIRLVLAGVANTLRAATFGGSNTTASSSVDRQRG